MSIEHSLSHTNREILCCSLTTLPRYSADNLSFIHYIFYSTLIPTFHLYFFYLSFFFYFYYIMSSLSSFFPFLLFFFFFLNDPAPPEISPFPLPDPFPI